MPSEYPEMFEIIPLGTVQLTIAVDGNDYFVEVKRGEWPYLIRRKLSHGELLHWVKERVKSDVIVIAFCPAENKALQQELIEAGAKCEGASRG